MKKDLCTKEEYKKSVREATISMREDIVSCLEEEGKKVINKIFKLEYKYYKNISYKENHTSTLKKYYKSGGAFLCK